ncbi:hypothetical protein B7494_g6549 [Chlorociboria aeruginascens]|nr:hypothetical protein B7494_g6549 [Chlorociboria aeruginascens]
MADDGTRWSHTSGEAEELNKLTTSFDIVNSSGNNTRRDRQQRAERKREEREKKEQEAKDKEEQEARDKEEQEAREKGQGK